jgi:serine phosphatase RsbU (regulator of sigma subunit)
MPKEASGVPLGVMEGFGFDTCQVTLEPGDSLLMLSDGVPDALDKRENQFTMKGVLRAVQEAGTAGPRQLGERIIKAVQSHAAGRSPHDDITLVCLGRT